MKNQLKSIFALLAFLFMTSGIQAMTTATSDHECKCPNKETCCVSKEHCATCPSCKDCCKGDKLCSAEAGHGKGEHACKDGDKNCCKKGKGKKGKGKACSTEAGKDCCKKGNKSESK